MQDNIGPDCNIALKAKLFIKNHFILYFLFSLSHSHTEAHTTLVLVPLLLHRTKIKGCRIITFVKKIFVNSKPNLTSLQLLSFLSFEYSYLVPLFSTAICLVMFILKRFTEHRR